MSEVGQYFKPEFINRIDETVVFHPLVSEQIQQIAAIQIQALSARLAERDMKLQVSKEALALISEAGFDPLFGARPLKRAIRQGIENPLAQYILAGKYTGNSVIKVELSNGEIVFS